MKEVFDFKDFIPYNTRARPEMKCPPAHTTHHGLQTASYIGTQLWNALPNLVRDSENIDSFMSSVRTLPDLLCRCRLCADFVAGLGYIT